jgi:hypothetical protein
MSLRDQMFADLDIFFNPFDFARERVIDGRTLLVVEEDEGAGMDGNRPGVSIDVRSLHLRAADMPRPAIHQRLTLDGQDWTVSRTALHEGELVIQVFREAS